jgi:hypothetical protein
MGAATSRGARGLECALAALRADDDGRLAEALNGLCCTGVSADASFVVESARGRWDLMHVAAAYGAVRCISLLCDRGSRVDICGGPDKLLTPLMVAAAAGQDAAGVSLLAHGADVTARDGAGHTAVRYAAWAGSWKLLHAMATCRPSQAPPGVVHVRDIASAFTATAEAALAAATIGDGRLTPERRLGALTRLIDKFPSLADKSRVNWDVNDLAPDGSSLLALALDAAPAVPPSVAHLHRRLVLHLLQRGARLVSQLSSASPAGDAGGAPAVARRRLDALLVLLTGDAAALNTEVGQSATSSSPSTLLYARYLRPLKALNWAYVSVGDADAQAAAAARVDAAADQLRAAGVPDLYAFPVFARLLAGDTAGAVALLPPDDPGRLAATFDRHECPTLMTPSALQHGDSVLTAAVRLRNYAVFSHILAAVKAAREQEQSQGGGATAESSSSAVTQPPLLRRLAAVIDGDGPVERSPLAAAISPAQPFAASNGPQPPSAAATVPAMTLGQPAAVPDTTLQADAAGDASAHADGSRGGSSHGNDDDNDDDGDDAGSASASPLLRASSLSSTTSAAAAAPASPAPRSAFSVRAVPLSSEADVAVRKAMIADLLGAGACPDVAVTFVARPCQDSLEYRHEVTGVAHAALSGDVDTVVALLRAGATPNGCDMERARPKPLSSSSSSAAGGGGGGSIVGFADLPAVPGVLEAMRAYIQYLPRLKKLRHTRRGYRLIAAARDAFMGLLPVITAESAHPLRAVAADFVAYAPPGRVDAMLALVRGGANPCTPFTLTGKLELGGADTLLRKAVRRGLHACDVGALLDACAAAGHDLLACENAANLRARLPEAPHRQLVRTAGVLDFDPRAPPGPQRATEAGMTASTRLALHHALLEAWMPLTDELCRAYEDGVPATEEEEEDAAAAARGGNGEEGENEEAEVYSAKHPEDRQLVADVPVFSALHAAVRWSAAAGLPLAERRARQLEFTGLLLGRGAALSGEGWRRVLVTAVALCNEPLAVLLAAAKPSAAEAAAAAALAALDDGAASPTSASEAAADAAAAADAGTPLAASRHAANASTFFYPVSPDGDVERQEEEWASDDPRGYRTYRNWLAADRRARLQPWAAAVAVALRLGKAPFDAMRTAQAQVRAASSSTSSSSLHEEVDAHDHTLML